MTCRHIPSPEWEMRNENQSVHSYLVIKSILQVMIVGIATCYHGNTTVPTYTSYQYLNKNQLETGLIDKCGFFLSLSVSTHYYYV